MINSTEISLYYEIMGIILNFSKDNIIIGFVWKSLNLFMLSKLKKYIFTNINNDNIIIEPVGQ